MLSFLLLLAITVHEPARGQRDFTLVSNVRLVLLDVGVRGPGGAFVPGLRREHFRIRDNGKEQAISSFSQEDLPVSIGLVVDCSGSMKSRRAEVVISALLLIRESHPDDEVFLVSFHDRVEMGLPPGVPFTNDRGLLREALLRQSMQGRTALRDGLSQALGHLQTGTKQRKAIVLISDGGDTASSATAAELLELVRMSQTTIYTIELFDDSTSERDPGFLKRLADLSGGEYFRQKPEQNLEEISRRIARDIRARYLIGFAPGESSKREVRRIQVEVSSPGAGKLTARTRQSYISSPVSEEGSK